MAPSWVEKSMIPAAPLQDTIRRKAEAHGSVMQLAHHICYRLGLSEKDAQNALQRLMPKERVSIYAADRFLTAMGVHVIEVYGFEVFAQHIDLGEDDVMSEEECC